MPAIFGSATGAVPRKSSERPIRDANLTRVKTLATSSAHCLCTTLLAECWMHHLSEPILPRLLQVVSLLVHDTTSKGLQRACLWRLWRRKQWGSVLLLQLGSASLLCVSCG